MQQRTVANIRQQRKQRHFKNKRDQILRALGKASYINGSHFAILWVNSRGETEHYASEVFQSKLGVWFNPEVVTQARQLVASAGEAQSSLDNGLSLIAENEAEDDVRVDCEEDDSLEPDDHAMGVPIMAWDRVISVDEKKQTGGDHKPEFHVGPYTNEIKQRSQAPELRRTYSMPNPLLQAHNMPSQADVTAVKLIHMNNRPEPLDLKATLEEAKFHMPLGPPNSSNPEYKALIIGDYAEVTAFLETRFRQLQQLVCKIVAKAWIKVIEPKKQTRYPYNKGEDSRPTWWPDDVRHKEPDHLMKPERISLLMIMLRCGKVPTNRLELATAEVAAFIPPDKINLLREIYRVAREEERFRCREIPGETRIFVAATASVNLGGLDDLNSPSTANSMLPSTEHAHHMPPRSASLQDTHMALQRSTSHQTSQYDETDPFADNTDLQTSYAMMPPQNFYYGSGEGGYGSQANSAVMNASSHSLSAQQFQHAQQQQMFAAQQAHARRQSTQANPILPSVQNPYTQVTWQQNMDPHNWPQSPPNSAAFQQNSLDQQLREAQHHHLAATNQTSFYAQTAPVETPAKQTARPQQDDKIRSSPYLPTPLQADPNYSAQRNAAHGVSFSDYLNSPRTVGREPLHEDEHGDDMHEDY